MHCASGFSAHESSVRTINLTQKPLPLGGPLRSLRAQLPSLPSAHVNLLAFWNNPPLRRWAPMPLSVQGSMYSWHCMERSDFFIVGWRSRVSCTRPASNINIMQWSTAHCPQPTMGFLVSMPAYYTSVSESFCGVKTITVFPGNAGTAHSAHQGVVNLFDPMDHGKLLAVVDAHEVTAIRTAGE
jgi:hypothetical protein